MWILFACSPGTPIVHVRAASSLTDVLGDLEARFEAEERVDLQLSFAGSHTVAFQVRQGAPTDAVALAHPELLEDLHRDGLVRVPSALATNQLVIAAKDRALTLADLPGVERVVLGTSASPIGRYSDEVIGELPVQVVSREPNVRLVRAKLLLGEADAAILYASDVRAPLVATPLDRRVTLTQAAVNDAGARWTRWLAAQDLPGLGPSP